MPNLTAEQQTFVRNIVKDVKKGEPTVRGGGISGSGKSTCLAVLADVLNGFSVCAYTGKAVSVLRKKGLQASTIHSLIYKPSLVGNKVEFILQEPHELYNDGFIVDESSMISGEIYQDLLSFKRPVIFIGDHGQLEPIGQSINLMKNPTYKLETVHRNAGEIAFFADHIRKGKSPTTFKTNGKVQIIESGDVTDKMMLECQMVCAFNKTRVSKNNHVRKLLGYKDLLHVGENIICLRNNKRIGIFNGMQGIVTKIKGHKLDFLVDDMEFLDISYDPKQFGEEKNKFEFGSDSPNPFDYGYILTCHKVQGSEYDNVVVFEQQCDKWDSVSWLYTAVSRAMENVTLVTSKRYCPNWLK